MFGSITEASNIQANPHLFFFSNPGYPDASAANTDIDDEDDGPAKLSSDDLELALTHFNFFKKTTCMQTT